MTADHRNTPIDELPRGPLLELCQNAIAATVDYQQAGHVLLQCVQAAAQALDDGDPAFARQLLQRPLTSLEGAAREH